MYVAFVTFLLCVQAQLLYSSPPHRQRSFNTEKTLSLSLLHAFMSMQYWIDDDDERVNERDYSPKEVEKKDTKQN